MLKQKSIKEIAENWQEYREPVKRAFFATPGGLAMGGDKYDDFEHIIKLKLTNPFNTSMQLWSSEEDGEVNYIVLTKLQICEFSQIKSLLLFTGTRVNDVEELTMQEAYADGYVALTSFAQKHNCEAIMAYSDLDYFVDKIKTTSFFDGVIKRNFFYLPLNN